MPIFRFHRGGLHESMETCVNVENSFELLDVINKSFQEWINSGIINKANDRPIKELFIKYYCFDERINWDTYIVIAAPLIEIIKKPFPVGFMNGLFDDWEPGKKIYSIQG